MRYTIEFCVALMINLAKVKQLFISLGTPFLRHGAQYFSSNKKGVIQHAHNHVVEHKSQLLN